MRIVALAFAVFCGAIIVGLAAWFGFKTSANAVDGYITAFLYGSATLGGFLLHWFGVGMIGRYKKPVVGSTFLMIGAIALTVSLANSLGATAERMDETKAQRLQTAKSVADDRRDLKRMQDERDTIRFDAADENTIRAANAAETNAANAKYAECKSGRGQACIEKERAETEAVAHKAKVIADKVASDRAAKLDKDIQDLKERIAKAGPVLDENSHGKAIANILSLGDGSASRISTYQNASVPLVVELLVACFLVSFEMIPKPVAQPKAPPSAPRRKRTYQRRVADGQSAKIIAMPDTDPAEAIRLVLSGTPKKKVAETYRVTVRTVDRWLERHNKANEMAETAL